MELFDIKKHIKEKKFDNLYIFTGEEWKIIQIYTEKIATTSDKELVRKNSIEEVYAELKVGKNLFGKSRCFVVMDDKNVDGTKLDAIKPLLEQEDSILILIYYSIDKRNKLYKQNKDIFIEFNKQTTETLVKYLSKEIDLNESNLRLLVSLCENDYGRLLLEIDKIKSFSNNHNDGFKELLNRGQIYMPPKDAIFELVDAILTKKAKLAYELLQHCKEIGEANLTILSVLFTNTKQVLQVQSCGDGNISKVTGLTNWQVIKAKEKSNYYSNRQLINIMTLVQRVEEGIKLGRIEDSVSVEYVLEEIFR